MRTIEVNLIGDLKQKTIAKKEVSLSTVLPTGGKTPEESKKQIILYAVVGSAIACFLLIGLILIIVLAYSFYLDVRIAGIKDEAETKQIELEKLINIQDRLESEKKELQLMSLVKEHLEKEKFPMPELVEEVRAKMPDDLQLLEIEKKEGKKDEDTGTTKHAALIKGNATYARKGPMISLAYFITNINHYKSDVSIMENAYLEKLKEQAGEIEFTISTKLIPRDFTPDEEIKSLEKMAVKEEVISESVKTKVVSE